MSHRAILRATVAAAAVWLSVTGCGYDPEVRSENPGDSGRVGTSRPSPSAEATPTGPAEEADRREDQEDEADRPVVASDCASYRSSDGWCVDGIGDYDCEGGTGDGPNYAPGPITVVESGSDPFGLDRNNDGVGCQDQSPPEPDPPEPPPDPGTDPRFGTCREAIAAGYGPYRRGQDPEYDWYRDADSDGVVCES